MLAGIVGFRIPISRIEGKFKLSQNRLELTGTTYTLPTPLEPRSARARFLDEAARRMVRSFPALNHRFNRGGLLPMRKCWLLVGAVLGSCFAQAPPPASPADWKARVAESMPLLGHRNWILVVDSAYPLQSSPGVETIETNSPQSKSSSTFSAPSPFHPCPSA